MDKLTEKYFTKNLLFWHLNTNTRKMPWKGEKDPYKIWLSEIILQQTRVEQGLEYYNAFVQHFPTINHLANAEEKKVFKLWEGLGYYNRCRNLIATAKEIVTTYKSKFPTTYEDILKLKGIGPYTAAAIASFAYNLPYAVVDGNVTRVLTRFFNIDLPIDSTKGKKLLATLAQQLLDGKNAANYNQAIMDFGATICKPKLPLCSSCPFQKKCQAFELALVDKLPIKEKSIAKKTRWFYYFIIEYKEGVYIKERTDKDIWQNLHEFMLIEMTKKSSYQQIKNTKQFKSLLHNIPYLLDSVSNEYSQILSHQLITGKFCILQVSKKVKIENYVWVPKKQLLQLSFPKFINTYLQDKKYL